MPCLRMIVHKVGFMSYYKYLICAVLLIILRIWQKVSERKNLSPTTVFSLTSWIEWQEEVKELKVNRNKPEKCALVS